LSTGKVPLIHTNKKKTYRKEKKNSPPKEKEREKENPFSNY